MLKLEATSSPFEKLFAVTLQSHMSRREQGESFRTEGVVNRKVEPSDLIKTRNGDLLNLVAQSYGVASYSRILPSAYCVHQQYGIPDNIAQPPGGPGARPLGRSLKHAGTVWPAGPAVAAGIGR